MRNAVPYSVLIVAAVAVVQVGCGAGSGSTESTGTTATAPQVRALNVRVSDEDRSEIAAAFARRCEDAGNTDCDEATRGLLYAARLGNRFYAFATFRFPRRTQPGQPELFLKQAGGPWVDRGPTNRRICVPRSVADVWDLRTASVKDCYLPPRAVAPRNDADVRRGYQASIERAIDGLRVWWLDTLRGTFNVQRPTSPEVRGPYTSEDDAPTCAGTPLSTQNATYCSDGDYIAWDEPGLMFPIYRDLGPPAPTLILGHEWGHAVQARLSWAFTAPVLKELGADCLAGAWMSTTSSQQSLSDDELDKAATALFKVRDRTSRPWLDPEKHGAGYQRIRAFGNGVEGGPTACSPDEMAQAFHQPTDGEPATTSGPSVPTSPTMTPSAPPTPPPATSSMPPTTTETTQPPP